MYVYITYMHMLCVLRCNSAELSDNYWLRKFLLPLYGPPPVCLFWPLTPAIIKATSSRQPLPPGCSPSPGPFFVNTRDGCEVVETNSSSTNSYVCQVKSHLSPILSPIRTLNLKVVHHSKWSLSLIRNVSRDCVCATGGYGYDLLVQSLSLKDTREEQGKEFWCFHPPHQLLYLTVLTTCRHLQDRTFFLFFSAVAPYSSARGRSQCLCETPRTSPRTHTRMLTHWQTQAHTSSHSQRGHEYCMYCTFKTSRVYRGSQPAEASCWRSFGKLQRYMICTSGTS